jgi:acetyl-CoA carboxylase biotin carboxyl carrier protein
MDTRTIQKLIQLIEKSSVTEIEIREGEEYVRISRASGVTMVAASPVQMQMQAHAPAAAPVAAAPALAVAAEPSGHLVRSPMVGTFYRSPSPGSAAFAQVGQTVKAGDVICIVEAMKMENEVTAHTGGAITSVHVEAGQGVAADELVAVIGGAE